MISVELMVTRRSSSCVDLGTIEVRATGALVGNSSLQVIYVCSLSDANLKPRGRFINKQYGRSTPFKGNISFKIKGLKGKARLTLNGQNP